MLISGEIDCLQGPPVRSSFATRDASARRLFPDDVAVEQRYYAQAHMFPIVHVGVLRRDNYQTHRNGPRNRSPRH